jgi:large subunit ribosomal protein L7/L12
MNAVIELTDRLARVDKTLVVHNFQTLPVTEAEAVRRSLARLGASLAVAKNSHIEMACTRARVDLGAMRGPNALVFAPGKLAEVLRDLIALVRRCPQLTLRDADELAPLAAPPLEQDQEPEAEQVATMVDVVLTGAGTTKIAVIKLVRELTSLGLKQAKDAVEQVPSVLLEAVPQEQAAQIVTRLVAAGATADLR